MAKLHRPISSLDEEFCEKNDDDIVIEDVCCREYPRKNYKIILQERLEEGIFQEFFKIGFSVKYSEDNKFLVDLINTEEMSVIKIDKKNKRYIKVDSVYYTSFVPITLKEHQLLHKLFKIWGWI